MSSDKQKNDKKCVRDMINHSAICSFYPKNKITKCLREASQHFEACEKSGVSSGDGYSLNTSVGSEPYRKSDNRVYINSGIEIPFNGKMWNGKCYVYYKNGEIQYFTDLYGNGCDNEGQVGNQDTSNGH